MKFIIGISLIFYVSAALAQKQNIYYLKNDGRLVSTRDSADFIRIIREPDSSSVLYNVLEYYKNNVPRFIGKSLKTQPIQLDGDAISFYPNGKRKTIARYNMGLKIGSVFEYYPNGKLYIQKQYPDTIGKKTFNEEFDITAAGDSLGNCTVKDGEGYVKLYTEDFKNVVEEGPIKNGNRDSIWKGSDGMRKIKFVEKYENGILKLGTATDSLGSASTYHIRNIESGFTGVTGAFYYYLYKTIQYPASARERNIQGTVYISFEVQKAGEVANIKVIKSPDLELSKEAIRVIKASAPLFTGNHYGRYDIGKMTVPIIFTLQEQ